MSVEFIGYIGTHNASETIARQGPVIDRAHIRAAATVHENAGFDRALLAFHSTTPDSLFIGQYAAHVTTRLKFMLAHRPGFTAPSIVARQLATLDHLTDGRVSVHIITGGSDQDLARDGDWLNKAQRYARAQEFIEILRKSWTERSPWSYSGDYYRIQNGYSDIVPEGPEGVPVFFGGSSPEAIAVAGAQADVFALWGETYAQTAETIAAVRKAAAPHGRNPRFSLSLRPIIAETEELAWAKAEKVLTDARALREKGQGQRLVNTSDAAPPNEGSRRLLAAADQGARLDKRLWTELAKLTGANGNSTSLVGTPDQVAEAMLDYYRLGVGTFLIRGFDPIADAFAYGRDLLPRVRALVAAETASSLAAE